MLSYRTISTILVGYLAYRYATKIQDKILSPIVSIENGKLIGIVSISRDGREFYEYRGIPYAKAERFEIPIPPDSWEGIRDASEYGAKCIHMDMLVGDIHGEEDCLFLNVFRPKERKSNKPLPVMVFIHGGHFTEGSSNSHQPEYIMDQDVVLVTINYRLGAMGFLNTGDGIIRGNMGLKDQSMSLKWIQKNIADFDGNPNQVTIFGESAGSACVHYHILSPMSKGLFHKAISQSGVALNPWTFMSTPKEQAIRLGHRLNCPTENIKSMVNCLKNKPANDIAISHKEILKPLRDPISIYVPSLETIQDENTFLYERSENILKSGNFNKVPWLTGLNSEEGLISSSLIIRDENLLKIVEDEWMDQAPKIFYYEPNNEISLKIRDVYFGKNEKIGSIEKFQNHTTLLSDRHFFTGFKTSINLQSTQSPVYIYYYTYSGQFTLTNILLAVKGQYPIIIEIIYYMAMTWIKSTFFGIIPPRYGICHADELVLIMNMPGLVHIGKTHKDYQMSKELVKLWTDFAKDEKSMIFKGNKWLPVSPTNTKYLLIDTKSNLIDSPFDERLKFWDTIKLKERQSYV